MPNPILKAMIEPGGRVQLTTCDAAGAVMPIDALDLTRSTAVLGWSLSVGVEYTFNIVMKHFSDSYAVRTENGSVSISGNVVKYTAAYVGDGGFWLNGTFHAASIIKNQPREPLLTAPVANTLVPSTTVGLVSTGFVSEDPTVVHTSTRWQVATDPAFTSLVMDVTSTTALTSIPATGLSRGKTYYMRVMHIGTKP